MRSFITKWKWELLSILIVSVSFPLLSYGVGLGHGGPSGDWGWVGILCLLLNLPGFFLFVFLLSYLPWSGATFASYLFQILFNCLFITAIKHFSSRLR
jgi:hypothetical protein